MTAKRIAAFLAAAALIVAALLIRSGLNDDSSDATDDPDGPSGGAVTVVCSTEFQAVCDQLPDRYQVTVEPAGATLDRLAQDDADAPDAWITLDPFPGMVDEFRRLGQLPDLGQSVVSVGTDDAVLAVSKSLQPGLEALCGGTMNWKCAGANAGGALSGGGKLLPGISDPGDSANGLLDFSNAIAGYFNSTSFDPNSWQDPGFVRWLRTLRSNTGVVLGSETPLSTLVKRPSVTVAATTSSAAARNPRPDKFTVVPLNPSIQYVAVVASFGSRTGALGDDLRPLLTDAGWNTAVSDATPQLRPGTFIALRNLWEGK